MSVAVWNVKMDTGHAVIDEQHRGLLQLHGEVLEAARTGDTGTTPMVLQHLLEETRQHFAFEEGLMAAAGYAGSAAHAADHAAYLRDLAALVSEAHRAASLPVVQLWLESRCTSWWKYHVRSSDAALAAHLAAAAARAASG